MRMLLCIVILLTALPSIAEPRYTAVEITGPSGTPIEGIGDLNNNGDVVGTYGSQAFVYSYRSKTFNLLPHPTPNSIDSALGLNDHGKVGGTTIASSQDPQQHSAVWYLSGGFEDLGPPDASSIGVSNNGDVIANTLTSLGNTGAVIWRWKPVLHAVVIPPVPGFDTFNLASAINDHGHVVGGSVRSTFSPSEGVVTGSRAYLYANGRLINLGLLGNPNLPNSLGNSGAEGLNNFDDVVGGSDTGLVSQNPDCQGCAVGHAFLWRHGKMTDLGTLGHVRERNSGAHDINDAGEIVGSSEVYIDGKRTSHPFIYVNGEMHDLMSLLDNPDPDLVLSSANKINCHGWITADGSSVAHPIEARYFLLVPTGKPYRDECPRPR